MKVRVGHLRCRYRVTGSPAGASAAAARLDRLARTRVSDTLADALDRAMGDDPTVYVVRRIESRVVLVGSDEAELARVWGQGMARAILRLLARTPGDGAEVVRFRDEADYAGSFVADLLRGQAHGRWYYGTFTALRALSTRDAVRSVLVERRDDVPAILQVVRRLGVMERLLAAADDALLEFLWRGHVGLAPAGAEDPVPAGAEAPVPAGAEDDARPVFRAVVALLDALRSWIPPRPDVDALWQAYQGVERLPTSWRDRRELTATFVDILNHLVERGHACRATEEPVAFRSRLRGCLDDLDWLDVAIVRAAVERLLGAPWPDEAPVPAGAEDDARPVFRAVVALLDALRSWIPPRPDVDALWQAYQGVERLPTSWRDRRELTATFVDILNHLVERGYVCRATEEPVAFRSRLRGCLDDLDWLDVAIVRAAVERLLGAPWPDVDGVGDGTDGRPATTVEERVIRPAGGAPSSGSTAVPARTATPPMRRPTPRQLELYDDLAKLLASEPVDLDPTRLDTTANALRLSTALAARSPRWTEDHLARALIERLLSAAAAQVRAEWRAPGDCDAAAAARFGTSIGREGNAVVAALAALTGGSAAARWVETECAGVFLLVRAAWDAGLPRLVDDAGHRAVAAVLVALGLRWSGAAGVSGERIEAGLGLLGGFESIPALRRTWSAVPSQSHLGWLEAVASSVDLADPVSDDRSLRSGELGLPEADAALGSAAAALLRRWAAWLRGFSSSSVPFLLERFVRRPGLVLRVGDDVVVRLGRRPLDVVLDLAGYTDPLDLTPLWGSGQLRLEVVEP